MILLITSWAAGLAAYAGALKSVRGEVLSIENWMVVGAMTSVAWLFAAVLDAAGSPATGAAVLRG